MDSYSWTHDMLTLHGATIFGDHVLRVRVFAMCLKNKCVIIGKSFYNDFKK